MSSTQTYSIADLVEETKPICYGVLKPGDYCDDGVPLVRIVDLEGDRIDEARLFRISSGLDREFARSRLDGGELLISIQGTIGRIAIAPSTLKGANISRTIARLAIKNEHSVEFVRFALLSDEGQQLLKDCVIGTTRDSLNIGALRQIRIELPRLPDQKRIAQILSTVDEVVEHTEALIAKHQQIKAGLMHDLFTRGVTPDGHLRPPRDEVPHLYNESPAGWIPKEWNVVELRRCLLGTPTNGMYKPAGLIGDGTLLVGQAAFTPERSIDVALARRALVTRHELQKYGLVKTDLLVSRVFATVEGVGQPALVPDLGEPAVYESNMMRLRIDTGTLQPKLLFYWLRTNLVRRRIEGSANASNQTSINQRALNALPVCLPGTDEQERMIAHIEAYEATASAEQSLRDKLDRLKQGLMHDLLTGRVRVPISERANTSASATPPP